MKRKATIPTKCIRLTRRKPSDMAGIPFHHRTDGVKITMPDYVANRLSNVEIDANVTVWMWHWLDICIDPREV